MKRILYCVVLVLLFNTSVSYADEADIEYISGRDYFETTLQAINEAQSSIRVFMFVIAFRPNRENSKPHKMLESLIDAKERGVDVVLYLDQNIRFQSNTQEIEGKNREAVKHLEAHGVVSYLDDPTEYSHSKVVVIDNETTILGSSNWSQSSFNRNQEANVIVRSAQFADQVLADLIPEVNFQGKVGKPNTFKIPTEFMTGKKFLDKLVTERDERSYDIYLYMLSKFDGNKEGKVNLNYDESANAIGIANMERVDYRRAITKVLRKLQDEYDLISVKLNFDGPAEVILNDLKDPTKPYSNTEGDFVELPRNYWNYGWVKELTFPGKVVLPLNWMYSRLSSFAPEWHIAVHDLVKRHGISEVFISDGTTELRKLNLINVKYKEVSNTGGTPKQYAIYTPNEIYDPKELNRKFNSLKEKHGEEVFRRAQERAQVVFKAQDYKDVLNLIKLEKEYGSEVLDQATEIVAQKRVTNPKRKMGYLIGTIRGIGQRLFSRQE